MELIIEVRDGVVSAEDRDSGAQELGGKLEFDPLRIKTIEVFAERLVRDERATRKELATLGEHLYVGLLPDGKVRQFVDQRLQQARLDQRVQLRLKLPYAEDDRSEDMSGKLADLPWEYLYCPLLHEFVVQRADLVLSRWVAPTPQLNKPVPDDQELRIGVVFANPSDAALETEDVGPLLDKLEALGRIKGICVERPERATPDAVVDWLGTFRPEVMHFIGHGGVDREDRRAKIVLVNDEGESQLVPDYMLQNYFGRAGHVPPVVLLDLPVREAGAADLVPNMARLGPTLIDAGVPAVIAMQYPFPAAAALVFSEVFYTALAEGDDIDIAVTRGRHAYQFRVGGATETRMLGTPVLYAQSHDAVKRRLARGDDDNGAGAAAAPQQVKPPSAPEPQREPPPPDVHTSLDEVGTVVARAVNGDAQHAKLLHAVKLEARTVLNAAGLAPRSRATVYGWFGILDNDFDATTTPAELADFIRNEWVDAQPDEKLRAVAEAMESTVRRADA